PGLGVCHQRLFDEPGDILRSAVALRQARDGFLQPALTRLVFLGLRDPPNVSSAMGRSEAPEGLPGLPVCRQGLFDEAGNVEVALALLRLPRARWFVAEHRAVDLRQPGLGHSAFPDQLAQPSFVQRRPLGPVATRSELLRELVVVEPLDDAIDPAEAQGLL